MRIGKVAEPGPVVKLAITTSSSDSVKASIHPATIEGMISGRVANRKARTVVEARGRVDVVGAVLFSAFLVLDSITERIRHSDIRDGAAFKARLESANLDADYVTLLRRPIDARLQQFKCVEFVEELGADACSDLRADAAIAGKRQAGQALQRHQAVQDLSHAAASIRGPPVCVSARRISVRSSDRGTRS